MVVLQISGENTVFFLCPVSMEPYRISSEEEAQLDKADVQFCCLQAGTGMA